MITDLDQLKEQENDLQFSHFDNKNAWELGSLLKEKAHNQCADIAIDIRINNHRIFCYAMPNTSPDNLAWIERKVNVVNRYHHSSWYMGQYFKAKGKSIEECSFVDQKDFAAFGGSFPLQIIGVGVIGSITVSGLPQYEDHLLIVNTLIEYLQLIGKRNELS